MVDFVVYLRVCVCKRMLVRKRLCIGVFFLHDFSFHV